MNMEKRKGLITKYVLRGKNISLIDETGAILERNTLKEGEEIGGVMLESILLDLIEHCSIISLRKGDLSAISNNLLDAFEIRKRKR